MATYYVRPTNGDNGYPGTSFTGAWKTTQRALDAASPGDEIRLCAEASETPEATINLNQAGLAGSTVDQVYLYGADGVDGSKLTTGHYVIDGIYITGAPTMLAGISVWRGRFNRVRLTNAGSHGLMMNSTYSLNAVFEYCRFDNASGHGAYSENSVNGAKATFVKCEFDNNGSWGVTVNSSARGFGNYIGCSFHHNYNGGCKDWGYRGNWQGCIAYSNGQLTSDHGFSYIGTYSIGLANCISYNNGGDGFHNSATSTYPIYLFNNIAQDNGNYGFYFLNLEPGEIVMANNCAYGNTAGAQDLNGGVLYGEGNFTGEPRFFNLTDGEEDFTLSGDSPLIGAGLLGLTPAGSGFDSIGALTTPTYGIPRAIIG